MFHNLSASVSKSKAEYICVAKRELVRVFETANELSASASFLKQSRVDD